MIITTTVRKTLLWKLEWNDLRVTQKCYAVNEQNVKLTKKILWRCDKSLIHDKWLSS